MLSELLFVYVDYQKVGCDKGEAGGHSLVVLDR